ncbi:MAG: hypothetical protein FWD60_02090 [Candidatus Azobacteroides sp.]|nr:hypothetical protein [Candidatus Azobacteroides sp.]
MFDFFKKRKLKSLLKKNNRRHAFLDLDNIHSILILFETSGYEVVDSFVETLQGMGKSVKGYAFRVKDDVYDYSETNYSIISPKENSDKSGKPSDELLEQLKSTHYAAAIDLTIKENFSLEYILAVANVTMTIGLKKNKLPFYDLSISKLPKENPVEELIKSILYYLKTIKGKETTLF